MKVMIIDDEPFIRDGLRHMLKAHEHMDLVCEAETLSDAQNKLQNNHLDLVLLDIQLRGGTGFDLLPFINPSTDIIFVTAHDEFAIRAFEVNALDYILKPVTPLRLAQSIARLDPAVKEKRPEAAGPLNTDDRVFLKTDIGSQFTSLCDITAISAFGGNYTTLHVKSGEKHICRKTFKAWESILPPSDFLRIHRSAIINVNFIEAVTSNPDGTCHVIMSHPKEPISVSRRTTGKLKSQVKDRLT